ncbi:XapX domain-containing protein [soil metagenome]
MKPYLISLAAGLLVGIIYSFLGVKSPAPPMIALVGLLGILFGEQVVPIARRLITDQPAMQSVAADHAEQVMGRLPGARLSGDAVSGDPPPSNQHSTAQRRTDETH